MRHLLLSLLILISLTSTSQTVQYKPYVPVNPVEAEVRVGIWKQQQYENNKKAIQSMLNDISTLIRSISKYNSDYASKAEENTKNYVSSISNLDLGNDQVYKSIINSLSEFKKSLEADKEVIMENYYKTRN